MKKLFYLSLILLLSCECPSYIPKSIVDNTLPEGIVVYKYCTVNHDMILTIRSYDGSVNKFVKPNILYYMFNISDSIKHCYIKSDTIK